MLAKSIVIGKDFLQSHSDSYVQQTLRELSGLAREYPGFRNWFIESVLPGLYTNKRYLILRVRSERIVAAAILKKSAQENKICTLWVREDFQGLGLGNELFNQSFDLLKTDHPLMTISSAKLDQFRSLVRKYDFKLCTSYDSYYVQGMKEYSFNGYLPEKTTFDPYRLGWKPLQPNLNLPALSFTNA